MNTKRIYAWIIDFIITCVIQTVLMILFLIKPLLGNMENANIFNIMARQLTITYCSVVYLIIRDIIGNKSLGKRILKLKIVDKVNGNEANFIKKLVRNITWLLGPVDIIVYLITKERIGDKITGTNVMEQ
jgi:uncharacterized RDD family membrane protein YckC